MLNAPGGVLIDASGNLIIADTYNQRIRKVNLTTGIITTLAGTGTTGFIDGPVLQAQLNVPQGLAKDAAGNIYFNEYVNRRIRKISGTTISTIAGNGGFDGDGGLAINASLKGPHGIAVDADGNIHITDMLNNRIRKVDSVTGNIATIAGDGTSQYGGDGGLAVNSQLYWPKAIVFDKDGNLFFTDAVNNRVRKINKITGIITSVAGNGQFGSAGDNGLATNASLYNPSGLAFDSQGNLFIADQSNHKIRKVAASTGIITTVAGDGTSGFSGDNALAVNARLNNPVKIAVDANDHLFIVDSYNDRIRKVDALTNEITTVAGSNSNDPLLRPADVIIDSDEIYVLEANRIKKINLSTGVSSIVAGSTISGYFGDGGAAINAQFKYATNFARDLAGNFFIADSENNRIRKIKARVPQTIAFDALSSRTFGAGPFELTASASSGSLISYTSSNINVASVSEKTVTILGAGTTTLTAIQPGDLDYLPSPIISQTLVVNKANQTITFGPIPSKIFGEANFNLNATATSGLEVTYSSASDKIAIAGKQVALLKAGRTTIKADQPGGANYNVALTVEQSFCINPPKPVITQAFDNSGITLTSSSDTGNQWFLGGELIAGATKKTLILEKPGSYAVSSTIDDCASAPSDEIVFLTLGADEWKFSSFLEVFPNPASEKLQVVLRSNHSEQLILEILDNLGRKVFTQTRSTDEDILLDVKSLAPGIYFIKAVFGTGQYIQRFIKN